MDGVDADAAHALAKAHARKDFVKRVDAIERFDGRGLKGAIDVVLGSAACIDDVLRTRDFHMRWRQGDNEAAKGSEPDPGHDRPVFEENKPPSVREIADPAERTAVHVNLDLYAAAVGTVDVRDHGAVRPALRLRVSAVKAEVHGFVVPDVCLIVHLEDGPIAGLLDVLMAAGIYHLAALRGDGLKALVLQSEAFIDCALAVFGLFRPPLLLDEPFAVKPMSVTLRSRFLLFGGKFPVHGRLLLVSLLLLRRRLLALKLKLLLRVALLPLELVKPRLLVPKASVFLGFALSFLLFQKLLLMLSRPLLLKRLFLGLRLRVLLLERLLLLEVLLLLLGLLRLLKVLLLKRLLLLEMLLLFQSLLLLLLGLLLLEALLLLLRIGLLRRLCPLGVVGLLLLLALTVLLLLLLLQPPFAFFFLLLRRLRLGEDDLLFGSARCP